MHTIPAMINSYDFNIFYYFSKTTGMLNIMPCRPSKPYLIINCSAIVIALIIG